MISIFQDWKINKPQQLYSYVPPFPMCTLVLTKQNFYKQNFLTVKTWEHQSLAGSSKCGL